MNATVEQVLNNKLNTSEQARQKLASIAARLLGRDSKVGHHVESIFTTFWDLARKADDMIDYSNSNDKRWLEVLQHVFFMCSKVENLPKEIPAKLWLDTISHFFYLMSNTCKGEINDLLLRKPSLSNYEYMVLQKTGPWFAGRIVCTALAIGVHASPLLTDLQEFGKFVSLAYQIRNDILDIETEQKDLAIGKLNYPSVLLMLKMPSLSLDNNTKISQGLYYSQRTIKLANQAADKYEEKAKRIALKYDRKLGQLTLDLCSSR